jgi:transposase
VNDIQEFKRQGLSISQISALTGFNRRTVRKYLQEPATPSYGPRAPRCTKLDPYKTYLHERLAAGVWNAVVLLRELKERGYTGGYTVLTDYLHPLREQAGTVAVRRFETAPGQQAQVDWGELGTLTLPDGTVQKLHAFVMTLGHSRAMFCDIATDMKMPTFLRMHEAAFAYLGGIPEHILYDNTKTVVKKTLTEGEDARGEVKLNPTFADFSRYWGFTPRLCRPYRAQTKGKVESGVGYLRKNFVCGRDAHSHPDLRQQMSVWLATVANVRVHGSTHRLVSEAWEQEKAHLCPTKNRPAFPVRVEVVRRVSRDAFVSYRGNRYSVPWKHAGQEVCVQEGGSHLEIVRDTRVVARHTMASGVHQEVVEAAHHQDIPLGSARRGKARLTLTAGAPQVEVRSLAVYEEVAALAGAA